MQVKRKVERLSCNYCYHVRAESIAHSEPLFVAFVTQHAKSMRPCILLCHLWLFRLYRIFPHHLINDTILGKTLLNIKCVLRFPTNFVWNILHSKNTPARYWYKGTQSCVFCCRILMKLEFSGHIFEKYSNTKFDKSPFCGSRVVPCGQTDGQKDRRTNNEDNSRFS
jgi:hypothetical protein